MDARVFSSTKKGLLSGSCKKEDRNSFAAGIPSWGNTMPRSAWACSILCVPAMSAGLYVLAAGAEDQQQPHGEDEIYYVLRGQARMRVGPEEFAITPGQLIFVPAKMEHRFHSIREQLELLVVFAPAESE